MKSSQTCLPSSPMLESNCGALSRDGWSGLPGIVVFERRADKLVDEIHELLDNAFIMRFDTPDAMRLTDEIDDVIDGMRGRRAPRRSSRRPTCRKYRRFQARALRANDRNAPGERPMRASALQRKIDKHGTAFDDGLSRFDGHQTSQEIVGTAITILHAVTHA